MRRAVGFVIAGIVGPAIGVLGAAPPASAACHAFTVEVEPATAAEASTVTVTVRRDFDAAPSSIDVSTIDETATGGTDYEPLDETVQFDSGTERMLTIEVLDDSDAEPAETFRVHLDNPSGCAVNPNYEVGDDAVVTIEDDDEAAPTTTQAPAPTPEDAATEPATDVEDQASASGPPLPATGGQLAAVGVLGALAGLAGVRLRRGFTDSGP